MNRCKWAKTKEAINYHDKHWCVETHDDYKIFEMLILEGLQAGLTWQLILERWPHLLEPLDNFDFNLIALYDQNKINQLLTNPYMIKNKLKVNAIVNNAKRYLEVINEFGSFERYIWAFVDYKQIKNNYEDDKDVPAQTELSNIISKDLKKRGFKFVGPVIIYSFMQSIGMINDHITSCFLYKT